MTLNADRVPELELKLGVMEILVWILSHTHSSDLSRSVEMHRNSSACSLITLTRPVMSRALESHCF